MHDVYARWVLAGWASFELEPPGVEVARGWLTDDAPGHHALVAVDGGAVVGWARSGSFRERAAYASTVETTVYLAEPGRGIGTALYGALFDLLDPGPAHLAVANVALPNPASLALHRRFGFAEVGTLREVGWKHGGWRDVTLLSRPLDLVRPAAPTD